MDALPPVAAAERSYVFDAATPDYLDRAAEDLRRGLSRWRLAWALARLDIKNRYRGSVLGPWWLTLSTAAMLLGLGLLYSTLFHMSLAEYLPHLSISLVLWNTIAQIVNDATGSLTSAEGIIRQMPLPYTVHALRCVMRNAVIAAHNLPLVALVLVLTWTMPGPEVVLVVPGFAILAVNAFAITLFLGMVCARFRDVGPIVGSVMQLAFFMTPVLWKPTLLPAELQGLILLNPFYVLLETVRGPLVEGGGPPMAWVMALLFTALSLLVSGLFFVRFRGRVAYWV
jgi:lipopolysaccharide transport system permease protein